MMFPAERYRAILDELCASGIVRTVDLSRSMSVSLETVRRDLAFLEEQGKLVRVHGGAARRRVMDGEEASYAERRRADVEAKEKIARAAQSLLADGQLLVIDVGTTALAVAQAIPQDLRATAVTVSLPVAEELSRRPGIEVLLPGGRLRAGDLVLSGHTTVDFLSSINADVAFLGSGGVDLKGGLTDYHLDEVAVRQAIMKSSNKSYVLADASKIARVTRFKVAPFESLQGIITDAPVPDDYLRHAQKHGVEIVVGS